jgi:hypothetical protein
VRGESTAAACSYAEKVDGKHSTKANPRSDAEDMRKRINRLENSILAMMSDAAKPKSDEQHTGQVTVASLLDDDRTPDRARCQEIPLDPRSTHWDAILNDVRFMSLS